MLRKINGYIVADGKDKATILKLFKFLGITVKKVEIGDAPLKTMIKMLASEKRGR